MHFRAIGTGERVRWALGQVLVRESYTPLRRTQDPGGPTIWSSWAAWAEVYRHVRKEFLESQRECFPDKTPASEGLLEAFEHGEDPGTVELPTGPDPRLTLRVRR